MKHAREDYNRIQDPEGLIPQDEPVFLLRGQDRCAPSVLEYWCKIATIEGVDSDMIELARKHANEMRAFQAMNRSKIPDMPAS